MKSEILHDFPEEKFDITGTRLRSRNSSQSRNMPVELASASLGAPNAKIPQTTGRRKNGKDWHQPKKPFRPAAGQTSYAKRAQKQAQEAEVKTMEKEMKEEKEVERQV